MHLLIFGGGATDADAQAAMAAFRKLEATIGRAVTLPEGEPRIVDSAALPGLKPGFRVVTLGQCRAPGPVLAALKAIYPGAYARPLTGDALLERCPQLEGETVAAVEPAVKVGTALLSAFVLIATEEDERQQDLTSSTVGFVLVERATGQVRDLASLPGASAEATGSGPAGTEFRRCEVTAVAERAGFLVTRRCTDQRSGCGRDERTIPRAWTETQQVTVKNGQLVVSATRRAITDSSRCLTAGAEGD